MLARLEHHPLPFPSEREVDRQRLSSRPDRARPLVSVIIPAYNASAFIAETLASAQAQTWPNLEIIVVDDGSTDDTAAIVEVAAATDPRITLIRQANAGVAAARNRAIVNAKGEYVAPLDADDLWHPENVEAQVEALERAGPGTAVAYAWHLRIDRTGQICGSGPRLHITDGPAAFMQMIVDNFIGNGSSTVIRRQCLLGMGGYDTSLRARAAEGCEDVALYLTLAREWDYAAVPRCLVGYRIHNESMSCNAGGMLRSRELVLADLEARLPGQYSSIVATGVGCCLAHQIAAALARFEFRRIAWVTRQMKTRNPAILFATLLHLPRIFSRKAMRFLRQRLYLDVWKSDQPRQLPRDWPKLEPVHAPMPQTVHADPAVVSAFDRILSQAARRSASR